MKKLAFYLLHVVSLIATCVIIYLLIDIILGPIIALLFYGVCASIIDELYRT